VSFGAEFGVDDATGAPVAVVGVVLVGTAEDVVVPTVAVEEVVAVEFEVLPPPPLQPANAALMLTQRAREKNNRESRKQVFIDASLVLPAVHFVHCRQRVAVDHEQGRAHAFAWRKTITTNGVRAT
jgi:hypothetical protein